MNVNHLKFSSWVFVWIAVTFSSGMHSTVYGQTVLLIAPTDLKATASSTAVDLSWVNHTSDGTSYRIWRKEEGSGDFTYWASVGLNRNTYSDAAVVSGATYRYKVRLMKKVADQDFHSDWTQEVSVSVPVPIPSAPTGLTISMPAGDPGANTADHASTQINLSWVDNANNEVGYKIERKASVTGTFEQIASVGQVSTFQDTGLPPRTLYVYRVRATNSAGDSSYSNEASVTTPDVLPAAPGNVKLSVSSSTRIKISWTDLSDNETVFKIERKIGAAGSFIKIGEVKPNVTVFYHSDLTPNTLYSYRVRAMNAIGHSAYSNEASAKTFDVVPSSPSDLTSVSVSASKINLSWVDHAQNETGFKIERKIGVNGIYSQIGTVAADINQFQDTGLTAQTPYVYRVSAMNAMGESAYSNESSVTTLSAIPAAPDGLTLTVTSSSQINLSWGDHSTNETGFKIERKTGATGTYAQIGTVGANVRNLNNTGLAANTLYFYRVRSTNAAGNSGYSNEASAKTFTLIPSAPTGLTLTVVSSSQIDLSWTDQSSNETGFKIERKTGSSGKYAQMGSVGANATGFNHTGISPNTRYYYRVRATNASGNSAYSNEANATTFASGTPPAAPSNLVVVAYSASQVELTWKDQSSNEKNFKIERKTGANGTYTQVGQLGTNVTTAKSGGLSPNTVYYYRVRASNASGNSAYSNEATNAGKPLDPTLVRYLTPTVHQAFGLRKLSDSDTKLYAQKLGRTPRFIQTYANKNSWPSFQKSIASQLTIWSTGTQTYVFTLQPVMDNPIPDKEIPVALRSKFPHDPASLEAAGNGMYDAYYHTLGRYLNTFNQNQLDRLILRVGHEMNGDWYKHSIRPKGATDAYALKCQGWFKATWRRMHDIVMQELNGKRVLWDFCPSGGAGEMPNAKTPPDIANAYPGDAYVDIISIDIYSGNIAAGWGTWEKARNGGFAWMSNFAWQHGKLTGVGETDIMYRIRNGVQTGSDDYPEWFDGLAVWAQEEIDAHRLQHFILFERDVIDNKEWHACVIRQAPIPGRENQPLNFPRSAAKILQLFGGLQ